MNAHGEPPGGLPCGSFRAAAGFSLEPVEAQTVALLRPTVMAGMIRRRVQSWCQHGIEICLLEQQQAGKGHSSTR
jgi:hypothetical protein